MTPRCWYCQQTQPTATPCHACGKPRANATCVEMTPLEYCASRSRCTSRALSHQAPARVLAAGCAPCANSVRKPSSDRWTLASTQFAREFEQSWMATPKASTDGARQRSARGSVGPPLEGWPAPDSAGRVDQRVRPTPPRRTASSGYAGLGQNADPSSRRSPGRPVADYLTWPASRQISTVVSSYFLNSCGSTGVSTPAYVPTLGSSYRPTSRRRIASAT